jgi:hypothetical protein
VTYSVRDSSGNVSATAMRKINVTAPSPIGINEVTIENLLNSELGNKDRATADSIKTQLAKIGVTLTYTPTANQSNTSLGVKNIKIIF